MIALSSLPVLTFHDIGDQRLVISFPEALFRRGMAKLHAGGYRTLSLLEAVDCLERGMPFPERSLVITFDDGYRTVYDVAFQVLQEYDMSATVFLTVGENGTTPPASRLPSLNGRPMLAWREIREMHQAGFDFGAHTLTHPDLTRLPDDQIEAEMGGSKEIIEDLLGTKVTSFAYPFGRYDRRCYQIARRLFACACTDRLGLIRAGSDPHTLERVDACYLRTDRLFGLLLKRSFPWYLRARNLPRRLRRIVQTRFRP